MCNYLLDAGHKDIKFGGKTVVGYKLVEYWDSDYFAFFATKRITKVMEWNDLYSPRDSEFYGFCAFARLKDAKRVRKSYHYVVEAKILKVKLDNVVGSFSTCEIAKSQAPVKIILARRQEIIGEV